MQTRFQTVGKIPSTDPRGSPLEQAARQLLRVAQHVTGMESTFVTSIDWQNHRQDVLYSLNGGGLALGEGTRVDWHPVLCRSILLSGFADGCAVDSMIPQTAGAESLGIQTFFAVPLRVGGIAVGTLCGASLEKTELDAKQLECVQIIAQALQQVFALDRERTLARARAATAENKAADAQLMARRHAEDALHMEELAHTDPLTGLPNRRAFMARWEEEVVRSARRNYPIGLLLLDADDFKAVNDTWGHPRGDAVLRAIGVTLSVVAKSPDVAARLGGDEFALLTTHSNAASLESLATHLRELFAEMVAELGVATTLSIGVASSESVPRERMLAEADKALYRSKAMVAGSEAISASTNC